MVPEAYFATTPPEQWSFGGFSTELKDTNTTFSKAKTLYKDSLLSIKLRKTTPAYLKSLCGSLAEKVKSLHMNTKNQSPTLFFFTVLPGNYDRHVQTSGQIHL
jgi:hypothetical protein